MGPVEESCRAWLATVDIHDAALSALIAAQAGIVDHLTEAGEFDKASRASRVLGLHLFQARRIVIPADPTASSFDEWLATL